MHVSFMSTRVRTDRPRGSDQIHLDGQTVVDAAPFVVVVTKQQQFHCCNSFSYDSRFPVAFSARFNSRYAISSEGLPVGVISSRKATGGAQKYLG
jgi:hypothetical protein